MVNQGKRMVTENLIAILKDMDSKGISISDLADVLDAFANNEVQAKLTAGDNITITDENVISATDTTYTAGTGININEGVISATGGALYEHLVELSITGTQNSFYCIFLLINDDNTVITKDNIMAKIWEKGGRVICNGYGKMQGTQSNQWGIVCECRAPSEASTDLRFYMDVIHTGGTLETSKLQVNNDISLNNITLTEVANVQL